MLLARSSAAAACSERCNAHGSNASRSRKAIPMAPYTMHLRPVTHGNTITCGYTSVPERMGEESDKAGGPVHEAADLDTPDELHRRDEARRQREQTEQTKAMGVLHDIETAALRANPEAGHPEYRRALDATDYPSPAPRPTEPAGTGNWIEPQLAQGLPWLGVSSTQDSRQHSEQQQDSGSEKLHDDIQRAGRPQQKVNDSIYDDNSQFEAWFNKP